MKTSLENRIDEEDDWDIYKNDDVVGKKLISGYTFRSEQWFNNNENLMVYQKHLRKKMIFLKKRWIITYLGLGIDARDIIIDSFD